MFEGQLDKERGLFLAHGCRGCSLWLVGQSMVLGHDVKQSCPPHGGQEAVSKTEERLGLSFLSKVTTPGPRFLLLDPTS